LETNGNILETKKSHRKIFTCNICNKKYQNRSGLWKHTKICKDNKCNTVTDISPEVIQLITELVKGQHGMQESILELCKNGIQNHNNSHNTTQTNNSHNKTFNLQFFLNETCKDAMNIMDFVDSIKLQLSDLERVGEIGFVDGISNIIIKNLNDIDETKRPVHCTDKKREVMYVKDEDKWEKEDNENKKVRKAIKHVANKNIRMLNAFKEKHPDCLKSESKYSDKYNKIVIEAFGGSGETYDNETKIIKNLSKEVIINKNND
jgi:hypothetical protein